MKYYYLDKNIKAINMEQFIGNRHRFDWTGVYLEEGLTIPEDATAIAVHGVLRGNGELIKQAIASKISWVYMDNAGHYFPDMYKRIVLNATAPMTMRKGPPRFQHNTQYKPWRGGQGKNIIVLPPSPPYMDTFGARDFLNFCAHNINAYTDKNIIIRAKPAKGKMAPPWEDQLKDAYCVVTWGSALALDAMNQGVPTISLGWCPAHYASKRLDELETFAMEEEPDREAIMNNLTWSSFAKNELANAYNIVMENANA